MTSDHKTEHSKQIKFLMIIADGTENNINFCHIYEFLGFEIENLQKIPDRGPALIVYYHGTIPVDFYYLAARCLLEKKRHIRAVGDNFLFHIPGK